MYKGARIAAVVPAYREEAMIATVVTTMPDFVDDIVIVDDCSPDGTSDVVKALDDPRVTLVRHEVNKGVGGAIITGHRTAMGLGSDVNVVMAGDAQMDPDYLPDLLDPVTSGGYGFAKANRFFRPDSYTGMPRYRVFGNIVLSFLTKFASGYWHLFDPQNGYTAIRTSVLEKLALDRVAERYSFENDLLIHLNVAGTAAVDVPIPAVYGAEVSSIRLGKVVPELLSLLFRGYWYRIWYRYVLWSFSAVALLLFSGLLLTLFGVVAGVWIIAATWDSPPATAGTVLLAVTPFVLGVQMLVSSLQLDIQESPDTPTLAPFDEG
ncbi:MULTISPECIES: glycosyltransferase family 2 protein [Cellulosimicrobium]|uniref:Glycosyltransferase family 2 protein n=1 Tax=Cellulosimicrobium sp. ES-005 TaxID=3163031 RepID=A0AAU8G429_9MICO|nr:glycosyltransferase family 2 protein [Cellulosimicrobium cellulans]MCO7274279.1 glycosyltransferase family 2 protein [Cellulosimicrobium cellulans]